MLVRHPPPLYCNLKKPQYSPSPVEGESLSLAGTRDPDLGAPIMMSRPPPPPPGGGGPPPHKKKAPPPPPGGATGGVCGARARAGLVPRGAPPVLVNVP